MASECLMEKLQLLLNFTLERLQFEQTPLSGRSCHLWNNFWNNFWRDGWKFSLRKRSTKQLKRDFFLRCNFQVSVMSNSPIFTDNKCTERYSQSLNYFGKVASESVTGREVRSDVKCRQLPFPQQSLNHAVPKY